jgi:hypothetical protein
MLQKYAIDTINPTLPAVREPILPTFDHHGRSMQGYGQALPPIDRSPDAIEMFTVEFMCSHFYKPFVHIYGRWKIGIPYQLLFNVLPAEVDAIGRLSTDPSGETLVALRTLDEIVKTDADIVFYEAYWARTAHKADIPASKLAAPLYERRLVEQERIGNGSIKRGHKAFGFYPLEGGG